MPNLGWTLEQKAGIKRYFVMTSVFAVLGLFIGLALLIKGESAGGVALISIAVIGWGGMYVTLKNIRKSQP